jgi:hypothetical protein
MHVSISGIIFATASRPLLEPTFIQAFLEAHFDETETCSKLRNVAIIPLLGKIFYRQD